ncbi:MAG: hypothetical protein POELPBGB_02976 [Bacteroidia bacterium]|nr:hypothetical protein [Bacteroidia bacterium]
MRNQILIFLQLSLFPLTLLSQENLYYQWSIGVGSESVENGYDITIDTDGNICVTGIFHGITNFGSNYTLNPVQGEAFLAKYNASGNLIFAKNFGNGFIDYGRSVITGNDNKIYVIGDELVSDSGANVYFIKYNDIGDLIFKKNVGGEDDDRGHSIAVDKKDNIYICGNFMSTADFDPGPGVSNMTSADYTDEFISKYDSTGNYIYSKRFGGNGGESSKIISDNYGNLYVIASFYDTLTFYPDTQLPLISQGLSDFLFAKIDTNGNYKFIHQFGDIDMQYTSDIVFDQDSNICISGFFKGIIDFDPSQNVVTLDGGSGNYYSGFVAKYNPQGDLIWAIEPPAAVAVSFDEDNNLYMIGEFSGTIDFDLSSVSAYLTATVQTNPPFVTDIYIAKYDSLFNFIDAGKISAGYDESIYGLDVKNKNVYITGNYNGDTDFDIGASTSIMSTVGGSDIFIAKYSDTEISSVFSINHLNSFSLYPNPTLSTLTIQNASGLYHLSDITGKTLLSGLSSGETFTLDISTLSNGVYFLTLSEDGQQVVRKVVKQ